MTRHDFDHFDVESSLPVGLTIPQYIANRPRRRSLWRRIIGG